MQVVCGAPNARTGMKGVFSPVGTYIPGKKITLAKGVIRGVEFERHAVLGGRARAQRRSRRHHRAAGGRAGRRRLRELGRARRSGHRRRRDPEPSRRHRRRRHSARPRSGGTWNAQDASAQVHRGGLRLPDRRPSRFRPRRRASLPGVRSASRPRRDQRPFARMDAEAAARDRPQADQRPRRHHQLHHLRPRPPAARVRPGQGDGRSDRAPRPPGRERARARRQVLCARRRHGRHRRRQGRRIDRRNHGRRTFRLRRGDARRSDRERPVGPGRTSLRPAASSGS